MGQDETNSWQRQPRHTSPISFFGLSVFRLYILILLVATVPMATKSGVASAAGNILTGCATSYNPTLDYFPDKVVVTQAKDFTIQYYLNYKLVTNVQTKEQFALYQCGTPAPTSLPAGTKIFPVPLSSLGLTETVELALVEMLGLRTRITFVDDPQYFTSPCLQKMVMENLVGSFSDTNSTLMMLQYEQVAAVIVFSADPSINNTISSSVTEDPGALDRAEWIKFIASLFNQEAQANSIYKDIVSRFQCVSDLAKTSSNSPTIAWVSYFPPDTYDNVTYPASYTISNAQYKIDYVQALGATPVTPAGSGYFSTYQAWQAAMVGVDVVIDETGGSIAEFYQNFGLNSSSNFNFIKNNQVWSIDKLQNEFGSFDWFEGAVANPDTVLEDLLTAIKPEVKFSHTRIWVRNISVNESIVIETDQSCSNYSAPLLTQSDPCTPPSNITGTGSSSSQAGIVFPTLFSLLVVAFFATFSWLF